MDDIRFPRRMGIAVMLWAVGLLVVIEPSDNGWYILLAAVAFNIGMILWLT